MKETIKIAIVPGSFDPITNGHMDLVNRALEQYDKVYIAVMINPDKKYMFSLEQRKRIAEAAIIGLERAEVISSEGMLWELALNLNACAIVKGYRNDIDLEYERKMADFNNSHNPHAQTVLLKADETLKELSSTSVRDMILHGTNLNEYIPQASAEEIKKILAKD